MSAVFLFLHLLSGGLTYGWIIEQGHGKAPTDGLINRMHSLDCFIHAAFSSLICPSRPQDTVSVHRPGFYADRFLKFMSNTVFKKSSCEFRYCLT